MNKRRHLKKMQEFADMLESAGHTNHAAEMRETVDSMSSLGDEEMSELASHYLKDVAKDGELDVDMVAQTYATMREGGMDNESIYETLSSHGVPDWLFSVLKSAFDVMHHDADT